MISLVASLLRTPPPSLETPAGRLAAVTSSITWALESSGGGPAVDAGAEITICNWVTTTMNIIATVLKRTGAERRGHRSRDIFCHTQNNNTARFPSTHIHAALSTIVQPYLGWLGSPVVSVLDSGAVGPGFKSQPQRSRVTVLGKLFTPIVPLFTKQQNW